MTASHNPRRTFLDGVHPLVTAMVAMTCLYLFLVGIGAMSSGFKMMGKAGSAQLLQNASPLVSLFIGILATTIVQSSSTTTTTVVAAVAGGQLSFDSGIYMVMGANVGTTVTNTIVSLGHITRSNEYRRAFAAATVHDIFNLIVLCIIFPLEIYTGFLTTLSNGCVELFQGVGGGKIASPINVVTTPPIGWIGSFFTWAGFGEKPGVPLLIAGVLLMFSMLVGLVKSLRSLMVHKIENLFEGFLFKTPGRSLSFGILLTVLVQSSSVTTSLAIPLVGAGLLTIRQVFPYTMGANIGTTCTALLASLGTMAVALSDGIDSDSYRKALIALSVAFHHVLFNVIGVLILFPVERIRNIPVRIAEKFADVAMWNRMVPLVYIIVVFYFIPAVIVFFGT